MQQYQNANQVINWIYQKTILGFEIETIVYSEGNNSPPILEGFVCIEDGEKILLKKSNSSTKLN